MGGVKVAVTGGKRFSDVELLHRALDAFHRKHHISTLITGPQKGAEQMAYFWSIAKHIPEIITVPPTPDIHCRAQPSYTLYRCNRSTRTRRIRISSAAC